MAPAGERPTALQALRLQGLSIALAKALTPEEVAREAAEHGMTTLEASSVSVWVVDRERAVVRRVLSLGTDPELVLRYPEIALEPPFPTPVSDAIRSGNPVRIDSREDCARRYPELHAAVATNTFAPYSTVLPLRLEGRILGALAFAWPTRPQVDADARAYKQVLAQHCAQALARAALFAAERRARAEAERLRERDAFLAEASALLAASVELGPTLESLARLTVPRFADWCVIQLAPEVADVEPVVAHADPAKVALAREWSRRYTPRREEVPGGPRTVLRTGRSEIYPDITDDMLMQAARDAEHLQILRDLHMRSAMMVPLEARGRTLGVITFVGAESGARYGAEELAVAEDLARRAALAIDNARLLADARRATRARDEFLSIASHELRNPLNALQLVLLSVHRAATRRPEVCTPQWVDHKLGRAKAQLERLVELVDKLLDVSRLSTGQLVLDPEPVDLAALAHEVGERHAHLLLPGQLRIAADVPVCGEWDRLHLDQALTNLLGNAIKYGDGKPIDVEVRDRGDRARVVVRDQGIGIAPELQERIFERFERAVTDRRYSGFGLGLWITQKAVEASGGTIRVDSVPGRGARFEIELPKRPPPAAAATAAERGP